MNSLLVGNCRLHELHVRGDARGSLIALEGSRNVPFDIARVYYIYGTQTGVSRGFHAHRALKQWAICVSGSCTVVICGAEIERSGNLNRQPDIAESHDDDPVAHPLLLCRAQREDA